MVVELEQTRAPRSCHPPPLVLLNEIGAAIVLPFVFMVLVVASAPTNAAVFALVDHVMEVFSVKFP